jgi:hypothetical protein
MFTEVCLTALGCHLADQNKLIGKDETMVEGAKKRELKDLEKVHEVLACLIRGVYMMDKEGLKAKANDFWEAVGYEPVDLKDLNLTGFDGDQLEKDLKRVVDLPKVEKGDVAALARLALFRRCEGRDDKVPSKS